MKSVLVWILAVVKSYTVVGWCCAFFFEAPYEFDARSADVARMRKLCF